MAGDVSLPLDFLIQLAVMVGSVAGMWAMMRQRLTALEGSVQELRGFGAAVERISTRLDAMETYRTRHDNDDAKAHNAMIEQLERLRSEREGVTARIIRLESVAEELRASLLDVRERLQSLYALVKANGHANDGSELDQLIDALRARVKRA